VRFGNGKGQWMAGESRYIPVEEEEEEEALAKT
jgi:hypothetical protein